MNTVPATKAQNRYWALLGGEYAALVIGALVAMAAGLGDCYASEEQCANTARDQRTAWIVLVVIGLALGVLGWFQAGRAARAKAELKGPEAASSELTRVIGALVTAVITLGPLALIAAMFQTEYSDFAVAGVVACMAYIGVLVLISLRLFVRGWDEPEWIGWTVAAVVVIVCGASVLRVDHLVAEQEAVEAEAGLQFARDHPGPPDPANWLTTAARDLASSQSTRFSSIGRMTEQSNPAFQKQFRQIVRGTDGPSSARAYSADRKDGQMTAAVIYFEGSRFLISTSGGDGSAPRSITACSGPNHCGRIHPTGTSFEFGSPLDSYCEGVSSGYKRWCTTTQANGRLGHEVQALVDRIEAKRGATAR